MSPYIKKENRARLLESLPRSSGELNYLITMLLQEYVKEHGSKYDTFNDILGALDGARLEFYRRVVAPYEDVKIQENGDVY
jgi:hypothetical protein